MVLSVALGIGVATAVFTLADAMLLRPLPYPMAERLVVPYQTVSVRSRARQDTVEWTFARYEVLRRAVPAFDDAGFATWTDALVRASDEDRPVRIEAVTRSLLTTFSIRPQAGRLFGDDEDAADVPTTVAMISEHLWRSVYGSSASIVGERILINAVPVTVVGIMPKQFAGFAIGADIWLPIRMMARIDPTSRWTERLAAQSGTVIARMAPGMTTAKLARVLNAALPIINQLATDSFVAPDVDRGIGAMTLSEARRHPLVTPILEVMAAAVVSLLAIVCANIASILLARGHSRRAEMGIRIAMGASQRRVGWQVLTESALLAVLGLPLGILFGSVCAETVANWRPALPQTWVLLRGTDLLANASLSPDLRVLAFAAVVAGLATIIFGVGPAVAASRVDAARLITSSGDLHASPPMRGRQFLVISQVALATILLVSAGLMTRSLGALLKTDLGFQPDGVVALHVMSTDTSASARIRRQELVHRIARIPGVTSIAMSGCVPFDVSCMVSTGVRVVGNTDASARPVDVYLHWVSTGYFQVMRVRMAEGRGFVDEDSTDGRGHVVISESAARRLFGTASVIGRQVMLDGSGGRPMDIVGVASDMKFKSVEAPAAPALYFFSGESVQAPRFASTLFVRTDLPSSIAIATFTREIRSSGAPMSVADSRSLADVVRAETSSTRFVATLLIAFAAAALLLAGLGIYGVMAYMVSQRTRELGVRILLGADERDLLRSLVGHGAVLVAAGISAGVTIAFGASRLVSSFLFGVNAFDAATYLFVAALVGAIGLLASLIPARRITRIDPAEALR